MPSSPRIGCYQALPAGGLSFLLTQNRNGL